MWLAVVAGHYDRAPANPAIKPALDVAQRYDHADVAWRYDQLDATGQNVHRTLHQVLHSNTGPSGRWAIKINRQSSP